MCWTGRRPSFDLEKRRDLTASVLLVMLFACTAPAAANEDAIDAVQPLNTVLESARDRSVRFVLTSGKTIVGRVAKNTVDKLWIRKPSGGLVTLSLSEIAKVRIRDASGAMAAGHLSQMADGTIGWEPEGLDKPEHRPDLQTADAEVNMEIDTGGPLVRVDEGFLRQGQTLAHADTAQSTEESSRKNSSPRLAISADSGGEDIGEIRFRLSLSEPAERSILILYSTVNGSAKSPGDYEHGQGVVVFEPGQVEAIVSASIVDDDVKEEDETLSIFITADPAAVLIEDRKVVATINDDD